MMNLVHLGRRLLKVMKWMWLSWVGCHYLDMCTVLACSLEVCTVLACNLGVCALLHCNLEVCTVRHCNLKAVFACNLGVCALLHCNLEVCTVLHCNLEVCVVLCSCIVLINLRLCECFVCFDDTGIATPLLDRK